MKALLETHLLPLAATIEEQQANPFGANTRDAAGNANGPKELTLFEFDELVNMLLKDVGQVLYQVYVLYFSHELKCGTLRDPQQTLK